MTDTITVDEWRNSEKKKHKYGAKPTWYKGRRYDSKLEADVASQLDRLRFATRDSDRVVDVVYQKGFILVPPPVEYIADFLITYADGHKEIVEAKGYMTREAKRKLALMKEQMPQLPIRIVKKA